MASSDSQGGDPLRVRAGHLGNLTKLHKKINEVLFMGCDAQVIKNLKSKLEQQYVNFVISHEECLFMHPEKEQELKDSFNKYHDNYEQVLYDTKAYIAKTADAARSERLSAKSSHSKANSKSHRGSSSSQVSRARSDKLIEAKVQKEKQKLKVEQIKAVQEMKRKKLQLEMQQKAIEDEIELNVSLSKLQEHEAEVSVREKEEVRLELGSDYDSDGDDDDVTQASTDEQAPRVLHSIPPVKPSFTFKQPAVTKLSEKQERLGFQDANEQDAEMKRLLEAMSQRIEKPSLSEGLPARVSVYKCPKHQEGYVPPPLEESSREGFASSQRHEPEYPNQMSYQPAGMQVPPGRDQQRSSFAPSHERRKPIDLKRQYYYNPPLQPNPQERHEETYRHWQPQSTSAMPQYNYQAPSQLDKLSQAMIEMNLPKAELLTFDGNPKNYHSFMSSFNSNLASRTLDPTRKLTFLVQHCIGKAKEVIKECHLLPQQIQFETAMQKLKKRFGQNHIIAQTYMDEIMNGPKIKNNDIDGLLKLSDDMSTCQIVLSQLNFTSDLDASGTLRSIVKRLPGHLCAKWVEKVSDIYDHEREPKFQDLVTFVESKAKTANTSYGRDFANFNSRDKDTEKPGSKQKTETKKVTTLTTTTAKAKPQTSSASSQKPAATQDAPKKVPCVHCEIPGHRIEKCFKFKKLSVPERLGVVQKHHLCFCCLQSGHGSKTCDKSCEQCQRRHHQLLHDPAREASAKQQNKPNEKDKADQVKQVTNATTFKSSASANLGVLPVIVCNNERMIHTFALVDSGSNTTLIQRDLADLLELKGSPAPYIVNSINGSSTHQEISVDLQITNKEREECIKVKALTVPDIPLNANVMQENELSKWPHLRGIETVSAHQVKVGLVIGTDCPEMFWSLEERRGGRKEPIARKSLLGWIVFGPMHCDKGSAQVHLTKVDPLQQQLEKIWMTDFADIVSTNQVLSIDDKVALKQMEESIHVKDSKYHLGIPWKENPETFLQNNRSVAESRLRMLKKRFTTDESFRDQYTETIEAYVADGHAKMITKDEVQEDHHWFLPHHGVFKKSDPSKCRVVFDCAATYQGVSLNDAIYQGPNYLNNLAGVLTRFRKEPVAIVGDIKAMFHQCYVLPADQRFLRFLWWPRGDVSQAPKVYAMTVHLFGAKSSPSVACYCMKKTADENESSFSDLAIATLRRSFYMDDMLKSVPTASEAKDLIKEMTTLLAKGGFKLTKFTSTEREVIESVPEEERAKSLKNLSIEDSCLPQESALGLQWNIEGDYFTYSLDLNDKPASRRGLLSMTASLYDPLGLVAPVLLVPKIIQQDLCRQQLDWDDEIPSSAVQDIKQWKDTVPELSSLKIPRCFQESSSDRYVKELHIFSDASESAYGAAAYLKVSSNNQVKVSLVMGKSRVAPIKTLSIPRLELTAATVAAKLQKFLSEEMDLNDVAVFFWTDSMTVLRYIRNMSTRFKIFVAHRVQQIQDMTDVDKWNYVPTDKNPADLASRGISPSEKDKLQFWLQGPEFLKTTSSYDKLFEEPLLQDENLETKHAFAMDIETKFDSFIEYFSCYNRLLKSTAWLIKYMQHLRGIKISNVLTAHDIAKAETALFKYVQRKEFSSEVESIERNETVRKSSSIRQLCPVLQDSVLCVGGRLDNASENVEKHPVILPRHHLTDLIIRHMHESNAHIGANQTLSTLRRKYYTTKGYSQVKRVLSKCIHCKRNKGKPMEQKMANLPQERTAVADPPFTFVGVDYFGPMNVKFRRGSTKRYGCIFTCLVTRAVHIEIAHSMDSDSFLMAFHRFVARRGKPQKLWSDNGTNFVAANKELAQEIKLINNKKLKDELMLDAIEWIFNPPLAPHMGGVWERLIKSVKSLLQTLVQDRLLTDEELLSFMCEVEKIMNDRPLTRMGEDPKDSTPLTPNHLLLLKANTSAPSTDSNHIRRRWQTIQAIANKFYGRFISEYLPTLQVRSKWCKEQRSVQVNDIVLVMDEDTTRGQWPLGIIEDVELSSDGLVRAATVRYKNSSKRRPIHKLVLLEQN